MESRALSYTSRGIGSLSFKLPWDGKYVLIRALGGEDAIRAQALLSTTSDSAVHER